MNGRSLWGRIIGRPPLTVDPPQADVPPKPLARSREDAARLKWIVEVQLAALEREVEIITERIRE